MIEESSDTDDKETVEPQGAEDLPGGSAPGGAQTRPEAQAGSEASLGEVSADDLGADVADTDDPMIDEPSEGQKGGARAARDAERGVPDTPATQATRGTGEVDPDETGAGTGG